MEYAQLHKVVDIPFQFREALDVRERELSRMIVPKHPVGILISDLKTTSNYRYGVLKIVCQVVLRETLLTEAFGSINALALAAY